MKTGDVSLDRKCYESKAVNDVSKVCIEDNCGGQTHANLCPILRFDSTFGHYDDGSHCHLQGV